MSSLETHYSASDIESRILAALRAAGLDPAQRLSPADLGALDHFHTGGLRASRKPVVHCIEMSSDYCAGAELLNRLTGLEDRVAVHQGSALDLPFPDNSYDVVWMQNVGMNIADKQTLYGEISRVLKPGGRYVFQEMAAGTAAASCYPLPWATDASDNFLLSAEEMRSTLEESGFDAVKFEDTSDVHMSRTTSNATPAVSGELGLAVFVDNLAQKAGNARRSLEEGKVRLVRGVFRVQ